MHPQIAENVALRYEPIVELDSSKIAGVQVVAPGRPNVARVTGHDPASRAPAAGTIAPGPLVLGNSCGQLSDWRGRYAGLDLDVTVSLSCAQFNDPRLVWTVAWILAKTDLPGSALRLDITEASPDLASPQHQATLTRLTRLGVRFVVTAFGTAFVGLRFLQASGVDEIRLHGSFVRGLRRSSATTALATGFVEAARHAGLTLSAEGIENEVDLARLRELGFERGQGPYVGHPTSGPQLAELLACR